jgi:hypothetical protein
LLSPTLTPLRETPDFQGAMPESNAVREGQQHGLAVWAL